MTRLISFCVKAMEAAKIAVAAPTKVMNKLVNVANS